MNWRLLEQNLFRAQWIFNFSTRGKLFIPITELQPMKVYPVKDTNDEANYEIWMREINNPQCERIEKMRLIEKMIDQKSVQKCKSFQLKLINYTLQNTRIDTIIINGLYYYLMNVKKQQQVASSMIIRFQKISIQDKLIIFINETQILHEASKALFIIYIIKYKDFFHLISKNILRLAQDTSIKSSDDLISYLESFKKIVGVVDINQNRHLVEYMTLKIMKEAQVLNMHPQFFQTLISIPKISKILNPHSTTFPLFLHLIQISKLSSAQIPLILNFLSQVGSQRNSQTLLDVQDRFIRGDINQLSILAIFAALKSSIQYDLYKIMNVLIKHPKMMEFQNQFITQEKLLKITGSQEQAFNIYQIMQMLPFYIECKFNYDTKWVEQRIFKQHQDQQSISIKPNTDIRYLLDLLEIEYIQEVQQGPYSIDYFIPQMISKQTAIQRIKQLVGKEVKSFQKNFVKPQQIITYLEQHKQNGIFLEIDGWDHFYDGRQRVYDGKTQLKRQFLKDKLNINIIVLKHKDLQEMFQQIDVVKQLDLFFIYLTNNYQS